MKKKFLGVLLALLLMLSFSLVIAPPVEAQSTWYVATTGSDITGDGSEGSPWATITYAIQQSSSGDTISVAAGTYTNDIWDSSLGIPAGYRITKSVTLLGAKSGIDPAGSIDRGGESILVRTNGVPYSLYDLNITIDGFTFTSGEGSGGGRIIISADGDGATIRNCIIKNISGTDPHGIYIYAGAEDVLIEHNTLSNTEWEAISCDGEVEISNNTIKDIPSNKGICVGVNGNAGINNNTIYNTFYEGIQVFAPSTIKDNDISECYKGIQITGSANGSIISGNTISDTTYEGIQAFVPSTIEDNDISGCYKGTQITGSANGSIINNNTISDTTYEGIQAFVPSTIKDNDISECYKGIQITGSANGSIISGNTISDTTYEGIQAFVPSTIEDNDISGCYKGTQITGSANGSIINNNTISDTTYEGIQAFVPSTITNNDISECYHGIQIRNHTTGTVIDSNNIHHNTYHGIDIPNIGGAEPDVTVATITNNTFRSNGWTGIRVGGGVDGSGIAIHFNNFMKNGIYGVESVISNLEVDATNNWWGNQRGPCTPGEEKNPAEKCKGKGDAVSLNVDYDPWLHQPVVPVGHGP